MNCSNASNSVHLYDCLKVLRTRLALFNTMSCRLHHEKVVKVAKDPFSVDPDYAGLTIRRQGFCASDVRKVTLGCAHTTANAAFSKLVDELGKIAVIPEKTLHWSKLPDVIFSIYRLDHEKGSLEKRLAVIRHLNNTQQEQELLADRLKRVEHLHGEAVAELERIRKDVLKTVDALLSSS